MSDYLRTQIFKYPDDDIEPFSNDVDFAERFPEYPNFLLRTKFSNPYVNMETMTRTMLYFIERKKNHVINYNKLPEPGRMKEAMHLTEK